MSDYFEDLRELQHAIDGTEIVYQESSEVEQHDDPNLSIEREEQRQKLHAREMRKLAARHEIERWNERSWVPLVPERDHRRVGDESPHPEQLDQQHGASSAQGAVEEQDPRMLPSWARKILAVADRIELENETVKKHNIHRGRLVKDGQGHRQYLATQQNLQDFQTGSHQQQPNDSQSNTRNGSQTDPQALQQQQNEQIEEVRSPASSDESTETVVPWVEEQRIDKEDGAADDSEKRTRRKGKGKATNDAIEAQEVLASNGIIGVERGDEAAEREVMRQTEIGQPKLDGVRHQEVAARASPTDQEEPPLKAGQDRAQSDKLERKQQQKAAAELRKKQRLERRQEAKRQKMMEERKAEEERKEEDEGFWQWLTERQLANPNSTIASLSKERYLKEARQRKEREAREARRKKQREERTAAL